MKYDNRGRFVGGEKIRVPFTCKYCGKKILVMTHEAKERKYCSFSCKNKAHPNLVNNLPIIYRTKKQRITRKCCWCGNKFTHIINKSKKYCSNKCYYAYKFSKRPVFTCEVCGKKYTPKDRHTSRQLNAIFRTCSIACRGKRKQTGKYLSCTYCGKKFYTTPGRLSKFCSKKCSNVGRNILKGKDSPFWIEKQKVNCDVCGKIIEVTPNRLNLRKKYKTKKVYCSLICKNVGQGLLMTGSGNTHWKGGISFEPYSLDWTNALKKVIKKRDDNTCQICGKKSSLVVHHIDYNKKNCNPNNLITLCGSCHSKTSYNREKWESFFNSKKGNK